MCGGLGCLISYLQLVLVVSAYLFNFTAAKKSGEREGRGRGKGGKDFYLKSSPLPAIKMSTSLNQNDSTMNEYKIFMKSNGRCYPVDFIYRYVTYCLGYGCLCRDFSFGRTIAAISNFCVLFQGLKNQENKRDNFFKPRKTHR